MSKQIVIDIAPDGAVKIDAQGFQGKECVKATEQIEIMLGGGGDKKRKRKPEFFSSGASKQKLTF